MAVVKTTVTIDHTKVSADLTDFPVYINLADMPAGFWGSVANGGGDIRCYKSDGTEIPREVVACDTGTDTGELHVKYSGTLSSSVDTVILIMTDGTSSNYANSATYGAQNVWRSEYKIVMHDALTDSTANANSGTNSGTTTTTGKIGTGRNFDGSNDKVTAIPLNGFSSTISNITTTGWFNSETTTTSVLWQALAGTWLVHYVYSDNTIYFDFGSNSTGRISKGSSSGYVNVMTYMGFVSQSGTGQKLYANGSEIATDGTATTFSKGTTTLEFGLNSGGGNTYWDGIMDEMRFYEGILSASWLATEYNNQNSSSTFYTESSTTISSVTGSINTDLVSAWRLESGAYGTDAKGVNNLTASNVTAGASAKQDGSGEFNGSSSKMTIADASQTNLDGFSDFSISLWLYSNNNTNTTYPILVSKWNETVNKRQYAMSIGGGTANRIHLYVSDDGSDAESGIGGTNISTNTWYHAVATWVSSTKTVRTYLNGVLDSTTVLANTTSVYNTDAEFAIGFADTFGGTSTDRFFDGTLDEVYFYKRALTGDEIYALHSGGTSLLYEEAAGASVNSGFFNFM